MWECGRKRGTAWIARFLGCQSATADTSVSSRHDACGAEGYPLAQKSQSLGRPPFSLEHGLMSSGVERPEGRR